MEDWKNPASRSPTQYKFLTRNIRINTYSADTSKLLAYTKSKRIYFRKIFGSHEKGKSFYYYKGKHLNCLVHIDTVLENKSHCISLIKRSKNLKYIRFFLGEDASWDFASRSIKKLPNSIKTIFICGGSIQAGVSERQSLYRSLSSCTKVQFIKTEIVYEVTNNHNAQDKYEYDLINRYCSRLRQLKSLFCWDLDNGMEFQNFANQDRKCPYVTNLYIEWANILQEADYPGEIPSLFRFDLFPNLRQLRIAIMSDELISKPSMIQGFKSLAQLKHLALEIEVGVKCLEFLFAGLLQLPLLVNFELHGYDANDGGQVLLINFLRKQIQLVWLSLSFRDQDCLENICQSLKGNDKLKYLGLDANIQSINSLSRGLSQLGMTNQLIGLAINVWNCFSVDSPTNSNDQLEGLCEFITSQKLSLRSLRISISCLKEDESVNNLIKAIGEVDKLQSLDVNVNMYTRSSLILEQLFQDTPKEPLIGYPLYEKTFDYLNQTLQRLRELEHLTLFLAPIIGPKDLYDVNSSVVLNALPALKNLRRMRLSLPGLKKSIKGHPAQLTLLSENKNLVDFVVSTSDQFSYGRNEVIEEVEEVLKQTQLQRFIRNSLTLYPL